MSDIASRLAGGQSRTHPDPSARLRRLARQLAGLNVTGRLDPEQIADRKWTIVHGLRRLARELDR